MFGWDSKGETHTPGKQSHVGEIGDVFDAGVNEALLLIWGAEERMTEWMTVMQADIPADGSFRSKDKCYITPGASTSNISGWESQEGSAGMDCAATLLLRTRWSLFFVLFHQNVSEGEAFETVTLGT